MYEYLFEQVHLVLGSGMPLFHLTQFVMIIIVPTKQSWRPYQVHFPDQWALCLH